MATARCSPAKGVLTLRHARERRRTRLWKVALPRFAVHVRGYGPAIGNGLTAAHPERVTPLIVQNANSSAKELGGDFEKPFNARGHVLRAQATRDAPLNYDAARWQQTKEC